MEQLNVQQTWLPVPDMGKRAGTDTIESILHKDKPKDIRATYTKSVFFNRPQKIETHRT